MTDWGSPCVLRAVGCDSPAHLVCCGLSSGLGGVWAEDHLHWLSMLPWVSVGCDSPALLDALGVVIWSWGVWAEAICTIGHYAVLRVCRLWLSCSAGCLGVVIWSWVCGQAHLHPGHYAVLRVCGMWLSCSAGCTGGVIWSWVCWQSSSALLVIMLSWGSVGCYSPALLNALGCHLVLGVCGQRLICLLVIMLSWGSVGCDSSALLGTLGHLVLRCVAWGSSTLLVHSGSHTAGAGHSGALSS